MQGFWTDHRPVVAKAEVDLDVFEGQTQRSKEGHFFKNQHFSDGYRGYASKGMNEKFVFGFFF